MGFDNPNIPWRELERRLSGRPMPHGDGGDSPAWSRKRDEYQPLHLPRVASSIPYAELHAHSSFSFLDGASAPEELAEEAARLGLRSLTLTDHDGVYGVVRFAEAAEKIGLATGFGAELNLDVPLPRTQAEKLISARVGTPDPPGHHLLALARDPDGYARLCRAISTAQLRGGAKGRPVYDIDELTETADGHWVILTGCRKGAVRQALDSGGDPRLALDELIARFGRDNVVVELTHELDPRADERYDALYELAQRAPAAGRRDHGRALSRAGAPSAGHGARRGTRAQQPRRDRRLAAGQLVLGRAAPAQRGRDGRAVRALAGRGRSRSAPRRRDRLSAQADRAGPAAVPRSARTR